MSDKETLDFYDGAAVQYASTFGPNTPDKSLNDFLAELPAGGRILDYGCGPGNWTAMMRDAGFAIEATDASQGMADLALEKFSIAVRVEAFEALNAVEHYDGIWANFSLLHAPRNDMPAHLGRIHRALKNGGILHLALKAGTGADRDRLGRHYTYYQEVELRELLAASGFEVSQVMHGSEKGMAGTDDPFIVLRARA